MNGKMANGVGGGNSPTLIKVDKLRELIGTAKISLPQLVVVGDQSSGKSSVLEGITGFAFPRDAELCTRYATQITCKRERHELITVTIIPHVDSDPVEAAELRNFHQTLKVMNDDVLAEVFKKANKAMKIRSGIDEPASTSAFSEHILKIEICGPEQEHFTVIDVPGIFRTETKGLTTESDIDLVRNMVKSYMKDTRTIILAIMPANVDPATQEILKLAREFDKDMKRTMGVLTKPDLAIEGAMQKIAIDHVTDKRGDLTLGFYIVKNRGPDDAHLSLAEGLAREKQFFREAPWSSLGPTGRTGIENLKTRVRELLEELIKEEFPNLRNDVMRELIALEAKRDSLGVSRADSSSQRAYLGRLCDSFQAIARDALAANYNSSSVFKDRDDLRLITRLMELNEKFSETIRYMGHTRPFSASTGEDGSSGQDAPGNPHKGNFSIKSKVSLDIDMFPELENYLGHIRDNTSLETSDEDIMTYIERVYGNSRGIDLGTFSPTLLATIFKEQTKNWEPITKAYMCEAILLVHNFISRILDAICPDKQVQSELWHNHLLDALMDSYRYAFEQAEHVLSVERDYSPLTLNHYFKENLDRAQSDRLVEALKRISIKTDANNNDSNENGDNNGGGGQNITLNLEQLQALSVSLGGQSNADHVREYVHDVLKSYYEVARKRYVDVVCQQAMFYCLLMAEEESPLRIFNTRLVHSLDDEQLDSVAGESSNVRGLRDRLDREIANFRKARDVLRGSGKVAN